MQMHVLFCLAGKEPAQTRDDSSSDEGVRENKSMVYDFDLMLQKKKEERLVGYCC